MSSTVRSRQALSLQQALDASPVLAHLTERVARSQRMLATVQRLLPPGLKTAVRAGPVDGEDWCLLVPHTAGAAKLRQLLPAMRLALAHAGYPVHTLRIKVQTQSLR